VAIADLPGIILDPKNVVTNIIIFDCNHPKISLHELHGKLKEQDVLASMVSGGMRFVTHYGINDEDVMRAIKALQVCLT
jgi:threonine aldolase